MLIAQLVKPHIAENEGLRLHVYKDTKGIETIGYGFNLRTSAAYSLCKEFGIDYDDLLIGNISLTPEQADQIFEVQVEKVIAQAGGTFPLLAQYLPNIQIVICDLIFNLGYAGFSQFHHFIQHIKLGAYISAAQDLRDSLWFKQVGVRGARNVALLLSAHVG